MLKKIAALLLVLVTVTLTSCANLPTSGLKSFVDSYDGYEFLYPNGWVAIDTTNIKPDVAFRDLIERTENVSVIISPVPEETGKTLADLGTPTEVGYALSKNAIAPPNSNRTAELVSAEQYDYKDKTYYTLEYSVQLADRERHNLASVSISRGQLFTFNISTTEKRWQKTKDRLQTVVNSFHVY
ncbi:photosystem II reaction center PsbP family protein [Oscillatoriales cyanobacterium LEGE 11467]|uniref:Photosystem II reaction center PsbP family protein n=1 Tax=Zarconia navalis LEGE 11467 TaxID=1828826 RepID=A0A928Z732_9CYAN|nr:photosystem II reaction center PsbP [Zarconia navalis]MBE9041032.1 photosystem II reaction center PsbP family protein [Zarconia navalis LEGE 11467]